MSAESILMSKETNLCGQPPVDRTPTMSFTFWVHPTPAGVDGEEQTFTPLPGWAAKPGEPGEHPVSGNLARKHLSNKHLTPTGADGGRETPLNIHTCIFARPFCWAENHSSRACNLSQDKWNTRSELLYLPKYYLLYWINQFYWATIDNGIPMSIIGFAHLITHLSSDVSYPTSFDCSTKVTFINRLSFFISHVENLLQCSKLKESCSCL